MTIFSKIAAGEIPSYKCAENEQFYAFLDIDPVTKGHTLVIPRKEVDYIFDMEDEELATFFAKTSIPFAGELYMGHLRYSTTGKSGLSYVHPFLRRNNWNGSLT